MAVADHYRILFAVVLCTGLVFQATQASSPYLQLYPPVNASDGRTPLHFALMLSFGGDYKSIGALPGVQIALDYVNSQPSILPGYSLHYTLADSQCNRSTALESFFTQINTPPIKVGWLGSGCSVATEPTAEISQFYNIAQVSCVSSSSELKNRLRFKYYFQLLSAEAEMAQGFFGIIRKFGWKRIGIITQNENLFTVTMDRLKQMLQDSEIEYSERLFKTEDGIGQISDQIFDSEIRIYVVAMYASHARDFICEAYIRGIHYPKYMLLTYGWYSSNWWKEPSTSSQFNCTDEERASVLPYTLAPRTRESYTDPTAEDESGISGLEFNVRYWETLRKECNTEIDVLSYIDTNSEPFYYAQHCHEALLAFAYALNKTITDLRTNRELNQEAAQQNEDLPDGENFTMANFTYNNSAVVSQMFQHLQTTSFLGLSGSEVKFNEDGTREVDKIDVYQYQRNRSDGMLVLTTLSTIMLTDTEYDVTFNYTNSFSANSADAWPDGIPNDGTPDEDIVTVHVGTTVVYVTLATAGVFFAVVCLAFTLIFRHKKLIRLSSPNLNYIIGLGAIVLYLNVITFVIPTTNGDFAAVICNINPWLTSLGYSLCYGTILVKTVRIWFIFNKPQVLSLTRSLVIKDYALALVVLCLVIIDIVILGSYTAVEGVRGHLGVKLISNKENLEDIIGPTCEIHRYYVFICESKAQSPLYAVLFGYKGLLQVIALILAFRTRKVKVKGLDDSKYIAAAIYVTSIVLAVTIVSTYTLMDYVNVYPVVVGSGFLLGTTMILALVFVPRMVGLYRDPEGDSVKIENVVSRNAIMHRDPPSSSAQLEIKILRRRIIELEKRQSKRSHSGSSLSISNPDGFNSSPIFNQIVEGAQHQVYVSPGSHDSNREAAFLNMKQGHQSGPGVTWSQDANSHSHCSSSLPTDKY